jgi:2-methylcitrate dehydratase
MGDIMLLAEKIADYVDSLKERKIPSDVIRLVKERIVDSIAVALGAYHAPPVVITRGVLKDIGGRGAIGIGIGELSPDQAAFLNGVMVRYIDFNDTYLSKEALHPSDNIPAVQAAGELLGIDGDQFIRGVIASYELSCRLADASSIRNRGWDHVTYIAIASAAGAALALDLPYEKIVHSINLATTPNIALRQTRVGELSMWKGCAAANAARNGLFAALLAKDGMTGPSPVFEGERGFFKQVSGEFDLEFAKDSYKIRETSIKKYPVEYHSMSAVEAALRVRKNIEDISLIRKIDIHTFTVSYQIIVKDPEKWDPKTKETADHSLPYIVATTLYDGYIWIDSYDDDKLGRKEVKDLIKKIDISVGSGFDEQYPIGIPNKIVVELEDGNSFEEMVVYPKGHFKNPMSIEELYEKYSRLVENVIMNYKDVWDLVWRLEKLSNIREINELINTGLIR